MAFVRHVGLLHVMTCVCWADVGGGMVEEIQPARVDVLCVLDILSCGSLDIRIILESDTDVTGCIGKDDMTVTVCCTVWFSPRWMLSGVFGVRQSSRGELPPDAETQRS